MPNLFTLILASLLALSLSACNFEQTKEQLEQRLKSEGHIAPTFAELNLDLPTLPNELAGITAQTYVSPIAYTAKAGKTYYYDKDGNLTDKPTTDGYYRKILGTTADGRTVAQDFYTNHAPQIAPVILKQGADESSFEDDVIESDIIWFDENGNIMEMMNTSYWYTTFTNGKPSLYSQAIIDTDTTTFVINYPNSQTVMAYLKITNTTPKEITHIYFYENGNAMFKVVKDDKDNVSEVLTWDETGKSVKPKKFSEGKKEKLENMDKIAKEILSSLYI